MASTESEWEEEEKEIENSEESFRDEDDGVDSSDSDNKKPAARATTKTQTGKDDESTIPPVSAATVDEDGDKINSNKNPDRRKRLRRVDFDAEDNEIDQLPSHKRLTEKGGYMHTKNSRLKISQANRGKSPWNKGKNRSDEAKAKIGAGVRARNHAILLVKLGRLGMTEVEWFRKKKQIKLLRERVRKAKVTAARYEETRTKHLQKSSAGKVESLQKELDDLVEGMETDDERSKDEKVSLRNIVTDHCQLLFGLLSSWLVYL